MSPAASPRARVRSEAGISLLEVLLASALLVSVMTVVGTTITALARHDAQVTNSIQVLDGSQVAMEAMSKDLHAAVAPNTTTADFTTATATTATFTAALGGANGPDQITIALTGSGTSNLTLTVSRVAATAGSAPNYTFSGPTYVQDHLTGVSDASTAFLRYYNSAGAQLAAPVATPSQIASVSITLTAVVKGSTVTLADQVDVFNVLFSQGYGE